ncbi:hypothetical protein [Streptomyces sp. H27-D2]|uniref:hypothetical protein n=1 Tax=Streptomyces sp. H27-D2 TaxID=3046304 RepID=UPI002DB668E7|nr:hypothetical protein [Streptomyces sp. H27-D2]MEC4020344.1 hypothetical protein [Streptomyces sp. H27-D2]
MVVAGYGDVTVAVDDQDDLFYTRAALEAHCPEQGRITVHPTPANGSQAALAHDVLYALGKRLAPGPSSPDVWLDSVEAAWLAAAAWTQATGVRHAVVPRAHLLILRRIDQLLAWRAATGVQLTLLWQRDARKLPPALARVERRLSGGDQFEALLREPGPIPARPSFAPTPPSMTKAAVPAPSPPAQQQLGGTRPALMRPGQQARPCVGAMATVHLSQAASALEINPEDAAALADLAHPLIAGALSVLAFTQARLGSLRFTRDIDITGDVGVIKLHGPGHQRCSLHAVPAWARSLLAAARAHHRLATHSPTNSMFDPVMLAEARYLRAHGKRLSPDSA